MGTINLGQFFRVLPAYKTVVVIVDTKNAELRYQLGLYFQDKVGTIRKSEVKTVINKGGAFLLVPARRVTSTELSVSVKQLLNAA